METRAREQMRRGVEEALLALGQGFLAHADNSSLRAALQSGKLSTKEYYDQLMRLAYRLIFLLAIEERGVLHPGDADEKAKSLYELDYSLRRLCDRSADRGAQDRDADLWEAVKIVLRGVATGEPRLALPALAGIFATAERPELDAAKLENHALLLAVFKLSWLARGTRSVSGKRCERPKARDPDAKIVDYFEGGDRRIGVRSSFSQHTPSLFRVDWRNVGPEELGSVYESLLDLVPQITQDGWLFAFATGGEATGSARKASGSYYTPDSLVQALLDSALEPVIEETIGRNPAKPAEALLGLSIVDPACGSGHFLLAAARRLASHVARLAANGTPSVSEYRHALRQVVARCIYGVDLNPMAVELCKVSLWMEAVEPGLALTFLDSHIQHGNALLGATPELMAKGIPDTAWEPVEGDDRKIASALKKRNKVGAAGQRSLDTHASQPSEAAAQAVARAVAELEAASDASSDALAKKETRWDGIRGSAEYQHQKLVADAWCAAFLWPKQAGELSEVAPTSDRWRQLRDGHGQACALMTKTVGELAAQYRFFHWNLQFPQVFAKGGCDVVLGNPPWVAHAGRAAQALPPGVKSFFETNYESFADYPTTHGVFVGHMASILRLGGRLGVIVPSSLSELGGYAPTRRSHDRLCDFAGELTDFGEGRFEGVTQPCMALVSRRAPGGRRDAEPGEPWPMARPDLTAVDRELLRRLSDMPTVPPELFGERGVQSDRALAEHFTESSVPIDRFACPIREGTDVREFCLLPPRFHVDREALGGRIRSPDEFRAVRIVVRQTARYPIAALSDGVAFRNSLLAAFELPGWPCGAVVALLNSALVRWLHYMRFRDARQPVMPQVKIGHLRSIPAPRGGLGASVDALQRLGTQLAAAVPAGGGDGGARAALDRLVFAMYGLCVEECAAVEKWHQWRFAPTSTTRKRVGPPTVRSKRVAPSAAK